MSEKEHTPNLKKGKGYINRFLYGIRNTDECALIHYLLIGMRSSVEIFALRTFTPCGGASVSFWGESGQLATKTTRAKTTISKTTRPTFRRQLVPL